MNHPTTRILTALELLQSRERVSGAELARRLGVSPRTVRRYVVQLQDLGVPIEAERGRAGAYHLRPGFRLPPLMFTNDEALAVSLGLRTLRQLGLVAFAPAMEGASAKLERVLPRAVSERVRNVQEVVELETFPWPVATDAELILRLAEAARSRRPVKIQYRSFDGTTTRREIEPYNLLHHEGRWYAVGYCRLRTATRTFRVDRMDILAELEGRFVRPEGFDALAFLRNSLPFAPSPWSVEVWLELPLSEALWRVRPHKMALETDGRGTLLRCGSSDLEWVAAMLLGLRCPFEVRQPRALFAAFSSLAERARTILEP